MNNVEKKISESLKRSMGKFNPKIHNEIISNCDQPNLLYNFKAKKSFIPRLVYLKPRYMLVSIIMVTFLIAAAAYAYQNNKFFDIGQKISKIEEMNDTGAVAIVGDKKITKKSFDTFKELYSAGDNMPSDSALLDKLVEKEVIYQQALKDNISISEEEVNKAFQQQKDSVAKDSEANEMVKNLIEGRNITEEEYWEKMKKSIRKALIRGKYINKLKDEFKKQNPDIQNRDFQFKFKEYYNNKVNSLKSAMKIEKFIK